MASDPDAEEEEDDVKDQEDLRKLRSAASGYYKFIDLFMKYGGVSPD